MLGITMKLDILARLTPQIITIICHHEKNIIKEKKIWGTKSKYINQSNTL